MEALVSRIAFVSKKRDPDVHEMMENLIKINKLIESGFEKNVFEESDVQGWIDSLRDVRLHCQEEEIHRIRNKIVSGVRMMLFITEARMRLLQHDEEWMNLDQFYRENSQHFYKLPLFQKDKYELAEIPYFDTHPLVQYSMSQCKATLIALLSPSKPRNNEHTAFCKTVFETVRDRVGILCNYPYNVETNDLTEYVVKISANNAICTSAFVYDYHEYIHAYERQQFHQKYYERFLDENHAFKGFLEESVPKFTKWAAKMIVTAAGDDFSDAFGPCYCEYVTTDYEKNIYKRQFPGVRPIYYKVLQATRGMEKANEIMTKGNHLIADMLKKEEADDIDDDMCTPEQILERMEAHDQKTKDAIFAGITNYATTRNWDLSVKDLSVDYVHENRNIPKMHYVPILDKYAVLGTEEGVVLVDTFVEAFCILGYTIKKQHNGIIYNKDREKIECTELLKNMLR